MAKRVTVDDLAVEIQSVLYEYGVETAHNVAEAVTRVAKAGAQAVATAARDTFKGSGEYAKGWTSKVTENRLKTEAVIYNKSKPGIAHLLEHGHVSRNGTGRTFGRVPAYPHVGPVEEEIAVAFEKEVKAAL